MITFYDIVECIWLCDRNSRCANEGIANKHILLSKLNSASMMRDSRATNIKEDDVRECVDVFVKPFDAIPARYPLAPVLFTFE